MLWEHSCWQQIGLLLSPSDRAEFKETAASWHAGTPNSCKGPVIYSQCASTHTGNMSCLARCLKPLIRFSVYQSEVMLLQRALTAIEKQPRFTKSSRMIFFLQTEHFCWGTRTRTVVRVTWFLVVFFPPPDTSLVQVTSCSAHRSASGAVQKQRCEAKTKPQTAFVQSPSLSFNRKKTNVFFVFQKKQHFPNYNSQCDSLYL